MTIRKLPALNADQPRQPLQFEFTPDVLQRFEDGLRFAAGDGEDNVISIMGVIGADIWSADWTSPKMVEQRLAEIGARDVVVNINSPGGNFWDGQAIFNMLRLHPHQVTVRILGVAASAASVIAMAGDRIEMPDTSWLMIHNTWTVAVGDRNALQVVIDDLTKFDTVTAQLYSDRSGAKLADVVKMMDAETFMSGSEARDKGFADAVIAAVKSAPAADQAQQSAAKRLEIVLMKAGLPRGERRALIKDFRSSMSSAGREDGTPSAAGPAAVTIDPADISELRQLAASLRSAGGSITS